MPVLLRGDRLRQPLSDREGGGVDFTEEDEESSNCSPSQAAVAIENARLYESATRWSRQLESLLEVSSAMARVTSVDSLLELIGERLHDLLEARLVTVALPDGPEQVRIVAATVASLMRVLACRRDDPDQLRAVRQRDITTTRASSNSRSRSATSSSRRSSSGLASRARR